MLQPKQNLNFLLCVTCLFVFGCATGSKKLADQEKSFVTFDLRSYEVLQNLGGWIACDSEYLKASSAGNLRDLRDGFKKREMSQSEQDNCAYYFCEDKLGCRHNGSYLNFSQVINLMFREQRSEQFTSKKKDFIYDLQKQKESCFTGNQVNSCAILSAYYRYLNYNRDEFFKIRTRECELLGINQRSCSFDL